MPFFSVVIPTYNRSSLITATLDSVFSQEFKDFDVIVVDDGSTDDTIERLAPYRDRITFLQQTNKGPGAARNLGVRHSDAEYIAFLDSDDLWFPWTLKVFAETINYHNSPALVAGKLLYFNTESELAGLRENACQAQVFLDYLASSGAGLYCGTCQMVVSRTAFNAIGGFIDTKINAEDHDFTMRLGTFSGFVNISAPSMIAYRQHPQAVTKISEKTYAGLIHMLDMEKSGRYPGGSERRRDRWRILAQHVRPMSLQLLKQRDWKKAWALYRETLIWNLATGRLKYLAGFPGQAMLSLF